MSEPTKEKMLGWLSEVVANYLDHCLAENIRPCQEAERAIRSLIEHGPEVSREKISQLLVQRPSWDTEVCIMQYLRERGVTVKEGKDE